MSKELIGLMKKLMAKSQREIYEKNIKLSKKMKGIKEADELIMKVASNKMSLVEFSDIEKKSEGKLSAEQIVNWRKVLCQMIGPYALLMPSEEIQKFRDKMQQRVNELDDEMEKADGNVIFS
jgi:2,3-bisphosphoglycerate-independent phosphoglycerate mutase